MVFLLKEADTERRRRSIGSGIILMTTRSIFCSRIPPSFPQTVINDEINNLKISLTFLVTKKQILLQVLLPQTYDIHPLPKYLE
jgi:hypothetical protein